MMQLPQPIPRAGPRSLAITSEPTAREVGSPLLDRQRVPRLLMSLALASTLLAGAAFAVSRARSAPAQPKKKTTVVIALTEPTAATPPPPPPTADALEPQPDRAPTRPSPASRAPAVAPLSASPAKATGGAGEGGGSPDGTDPYSEGIGAARPGPVYAPPPPPITAPPPPPPPPPPPKAKEPVRITEDIEPPVPISMAAPGYPPAAKSAGVEGTVVIQYVVTESGGVTSVQAVKGPPELTAACLAAVSSWKFKPALSKGAPVSVVRQARFPFRIKT
jgi:protein TonB